jgi:hypothetical protein
MNTPPSYFDLPILEVVQIMEIIKERGEWAFMMARKIVT